MEIWVGCEPKACTQLVDLTVWFTLKYWNKHRRKHLAWGVVNGQMSSQEDKKSPKTMNHFLRDRKGQKAMLHFLRDRKAVRNRLSHFLRDRKTYLTKNHFLRDRRSINMDMLRSDFSTKAKKELNHLLRDRRSQPYFAIH